MPEPTGGELRWSVRASFLRYVAALPDARASVSAGALLTRDDPQLVVYPADPASSTPSLLAFHGDLRLAGHGGLLFVRLAGPRIELRPDGPAVLSVEDPRTEDGSGPRLPLVTVTMTRTEAGWSGTDAALTEEGVPLFNNVYPPGAEFDPLEVATG
ncbi:HtaA domain-containing protein [Nocardioides sp. NPDC101246]|uniref:HtaA domain-containing protein n=1 Tax=Nocardioides sp. NPDC101246 TaxID=3364336 RepID=UPI003829C59A